MVRRAAECLHALSRCAGPGALARRPRWQTRGWRGCERARRRWRSRWTTRCWRCWSGAARWRRRLTLTLTLPSAPMLQQTGPQLLWTQQLLAARMPRAASLGTMGRRSPQRQVGLAERSGSAAASPRSQMELALRLLSRISMEAVTKRQKAQPMWLRLRRRLWLPRLLTRLPCGCGWRRWSWGRCSCCWTCTCPAAAPCCRWPWTPAGAHRPRGVRTPLIRERLLARQDQHWLCSLPW